MKNRNIYTLLLLFIIYSCGTKSTSGMKLNYDHKTTEILALKSYFKEIIPENYGVRIRFNSSRNIDLFVYQPQENSEKIELLFGEWDVDFYNHKVDLKADSKKHYRGKTTSLKVVKEKLNWTKETFVTLYKKLDNINCIGISDGNPTQIEYGFKGMGALSYLIFDNKLIKKEQEKYSDDCGNLYYKDNIVLTYASGAIGSFCIPEFDRKTINK